MKDRELYIVTDVDGTVVPHPYHAGLSQEERTPYVAKLHKLIHNHHVSCVTGRTFKGWERLWRDAGFEPAAPRLLGLTFGSETFFHGKRVPSKGQSAELELVVRELRQELDKIPEFRLEADVSKIMESGRLHGYVMEDKHRIVQLDWSFPSDHLNRLFAEKVFSLLNPHLARKHSLRCQVFHNRIDVLADGFVPKAELAHHIVSWVNETRLAPSESEIDPAEKPNCLVFGDELYDDYLFESIKTLRPTVFRNVICIGVHHRHSKNIFRHADQIVEGEDGAWNVIEKSLATQLK